MHWLIDEAIASSIIYWIAGLFSSGSISLGTALVAGKKRVPRPAAGTITLVISIKFPCVVPLKLF